MLFSAALTRIRNILQDDEGDRWEDDELIRWWNDGQRELLLYRPEANVTTASFSLTLGATRQTLPAAAYHLIGIPRNLGANGTTVGKPIRSVDRDYLDATLPTWHSATGTSGVSHFTYDKRDPRSFYVYPAQSATWYVELVYSSALTDIANVNSAITVQDLYINALIEYVLYKAYTKDAEHAINGELAKAHYSLFQSMVGAHATATAAEAPGGSK